MYDEQGLSHAKRECKYHMTWIPIWARGCHVSTIGRDEEAIRKYIKEQEREDRRIDQMTLFRQTPATFEVAPGFQPL